MGRRKDKPSINHTATSLEYLFSLSSMTIYSEKLLDVDNGKLYNEFLKLLLEKEFFNDHQNINISKISKLTGFSTVKISKWLKEIYNDIILLNEEKPELFCCGNEIQVDLRCSYFDEYQIFTISLNTIPNKGDSFQFPFIKAKIGNDYFYVDAIYYQLENNKMEISIQLKSGVYNSYRKFAIDKAKYEGKINIFDEVNLLDYQIDEIILGKKRYIE